MYYYESYTPPRGGVVSNVICYLFRRGPDDEKICSWITVHSDRRLRRGVWSKQYGYEG